MQATSALRQNQCGTGDAQRLTDKMKPFQQASSWSPLTDSKKTTQLD